MFTIYQSNMKAPKFANKNLSCQDLQNLNHHPHLQGVGGQVLPPLGPWFRQDAKFPS